MHEKGVSYMTGAQGGFKLFHASCTSVENGSTEVPRSRSSIFDTRKDTFPFICAVRNSTWTTTHIVKAYQTDVNDLLKLH